MDPHIIQQTCTCREGLDALNRLSGGSMTLFVTDGEERLVGTLTDGDMRRGLLRGATLSDTLDTVMQRSYTALRPGDDAWLTERAARKRGIALIPRLDEQGRIAEVVDLRCLKALLPLDAVLMAGGRGERLRPMTDTTPKPLLQIGGKAIIDYNVDELQANGVDNIFVTVNYLRQHIENHFRRRADRVAVQCVAEPVKLGTIGSLALCKGLRHDDVLVMNSDLLTTLSFADMYRHHRESGADLTMAVVPYVVSVPFAIVDTEGDEVRALKEKPTYNYFANAGVYIMKRALVDEITPGRPLDAPDFIEEQMARGRRVCYFPIDGTWIDIGSPEDFRNADKLMAPAKKG